MSNMLRTFKRSILHARLEKAGMGNLNKPRKDRHGLKIPSKFAEYWRKATQA